MAIRHLRLGPIENALAYDDGDFDSAIETTHTIKVHQAPVASEDVVRIDDMGAVEEVVKFESLPQIL